MITNRRDNSKIFKQNFSIYILKLLNVIILQTLKISEARNGSQYVNCTTFLHVKTFNLQIFLNDFMMLYFFDLKIAKARLPDFFCPVNLKNFALTYTNI